MTEPIKIDDGGLAFPVLHSIDGNWVRDPRPEYSGMSLIDYFSAQAITGQVWEGEQHRFEVARRAYNLADAMIEVRKGKAS